VTKIHNNEGEGLHVIGWENPETDAAIRRAMAPHYPKAKLRHRVSGMIALAQAAGAGMGMAYLACNMGDRSPNLVRAPFQKPQSAYYIWLLLHRDLRNTARVRLFFDFIAERTQARKNEFLVSGSGSGKKTARSIGTTSFLVSRCRTALSKASKEGCGMNV
jgi:hypothetical protein